MNKKNKNMNKLSILVVALIGLMMFSACGSGETEKKERVRPVKSLIIGDIGDPTGKGFPGVTKETQESEMSFRVGGPIVKLNVVEGAKVKKGALIAEIDSRDYRVTVQSTEARYNQTKAESDRFYRLWKKGSVAKNDYDRRFANYLEAEAAWEDAKNALKDTKLYAPYTGFFGPKLAELGEEVRPKQTITTIVDLSVVEVNTTIPEQLAVQFFNFDKYEVHIETYPDLVFTASLKELEKKPTAEGYPLHLFLDHVNDPNDQNQVKVSAGMSCRVNIILKQTQDDEGKVIIPITAVFEGDSDDNMAVWIINPDNNTVNMQNVVVGELVGNDNIHVVEGLSVGQQIVVAGVQRLTEGDKVNILK
jgi:RND family efflux transporter MFP subunit